MRPLLLAILFIVGLAQWSCTDRCTETRKYKRFTPVTISLAEIRRGVRTETAHELETPGKIYAKGNYLFINEQKKGLHVVDNSNPASPKIISFITIPGNGDMAVRGNILYADSYSDLVALDISNPLEVKEISRQKEVFQTGQFDGAWWSLNTTTGAIQDQNVQIVTETIQTNCENSNGSWWGGVFFAMDSRSAAFQSSTAPSNSNAQGQAGSMARFALYDKYLYTVSQSDMQLFDIGIPSQPKASTKIRLGLGH